MFPFLPKMTIPAFNFGLPVYEIGVPVPNTALPAVNTTIPVFKITVPANEMTVPAVNVIKNISNIAKIIVGIIILTCEIAISEVNFIKPPKGDYKKMQDNEVAEFDSAVRMIDFRNGHATVFIGNEKMSEGFAALETEIASLEAAGANRVLSSGLKRDATNDKGSATALLSKLIRKCVSTAKLIKKEVPDFDNTFVIRRGTLSVQEMLDVARAFSAKLTVEIAGKFDKFGAKSVNAANFNAKIAAVEAARSQQNTGKSSGVAATAATRDASKRLMKIRRMLAAVGTNIIEELEDAALLAEWKSACRVEKRRTPAPQTPPTSENS